MPNILDTVQISGSSYDLKDKNAPSVSAVTQQEYDNLPSSAKTSNTFFVITDAQAGDLTQYWTSAQTQSAISAATSGKVNTSSVVTAVTSGSTDSEIPTAKAVYDAIPTGGTGGGKAISAGTNISVTTGETADTISCTLPITANSAMVKSVSIGAGNSVSNQCDGSIAVGYNCSFSNAGADGAAVIGWYCNAKKDFSFAQGNFINANNQSEHSVGQYNVSSSASTTFGDSGNTLFSVGNGTSNNARHNAFEIRQNGDIYLSSGGTDIKLQDYLGGGSVSSAVTTSVTSASTDSEIPTAKAVFDSIPTDTYISGVTVVDNSSEVPTKPSIEQDKVKVTWADGYNETHDVDDTTIGDGQEHWDTNFVKLEFGKVTKEISTYFLANSDDCYSLSSITFTDDVIPVDSWNLNFDSAYKLEKVYFFADSPSGITSLDTFDTVYDGCDTYETSAATYPIYVANLANYQNAPLTFGENLTTWGEVFGDRLKQIPTLEKNIKFSYNTNKEDILLPISAITDGVTIEVSSAITSGDTNAVAGGAVYDKFDEVEQVTARALNELNEKINALIEANEVVARALNDLNDRITALENA